MTQLHRRHAAALMLLALMSATGSAWAQAPVQLRIGSLVPKNSQYHQQLMEMGEGWRAAQGGNARFVVFTD
ncbi:MAG: C4-dicarboxylate ABC transporter substrate-binding protein, partial [Roseateles sp.]